MQNYINKNIRSIVLTQKEFLFDWHLTDWCNYNCPYCIYCNKNGKSLFNKEEALIPIARKINEFILNKLDDERQITIRLIGGEVTYYNLINIMSQIEKVNKVILITNFSRDLEYFYDLELYFKSRGIKFILICSKHAENINFDKKFIELTKWCKNNRCIEPQATVVVTPSFKPEDIDFLRSNGIWKIRLTRQRDDNQNNVELSKDILNFISEYNEMYEKRVWRLGQLHRVNFSDGTYKDFICASNFTNFLDENGFIPDGFICDIGKSCISVDYKGDVTLTRCAYLKDKVIGNILNWQDIELPTEGIECHLNGNGSRIKRCDLCAGVNIYKKEY